MRMRMSCCEKNHCLLTLSGTERWMTPRRALSSLGREKWIEVGLLLRVRVSHRSLSSGTQPVEALSGVRW